MSDLQVIDSMGKNSCVKLSYFFAHFISAMYFEFFNFLDIELLLITLD